MSDPQANDFDDPNLKAAIRRAWGTEQCPAGLRNRVLGAGGETPPAKVTEGRGGWWGRRPLYGLAAAALLLMAVGLAFHFHRPLTPRNPAELAVALPASLADELVARHDSCCRAEDHHMPGLSHDDFAKIQQQLQQKLGFPILSARLPGTWDFHGASVCPVGTIDSGHLVFEHAGNEFVSIFSLPHQFLAVASVVGDTSQVDNHHPIAGFATAGGFYCVVGSSKDGSLGLEQIRSLRDQLRPDVAQAIRPDVARVTVAQQ